VRNGEGRVANAEYGDTFTVDTGKFTGRSPKDKWIVKNIGTESDANIDWGKVNQATSPEVFEELYEKAIKHFNGKVRFLFVLVLYHYDIVFIKGILMFSHLLYIT
jgi:ATP-dependent phosphoenolpyruvate carboxykinase